MTRSARVFVALSACLGLSGVVLAAAGSHGGDGRLLANASAMCLAHAPVMLALAAFSDRLALAAWVGALIAGGTALFASDLVLRQVTGSALLPMAAPAGGMTMIAGWVLLLVAAFLPPKS